jgi:hypothetical protein
VVLNGVLTNCATYSTCSYNYFDDADFANWNKPVHGSYRVFWYSSVSTNICGPTSELYFKTSVGDGDFDITANQIAAGQILARDYSCPCCYDALAAYQPIGGEIKGKKTDATHWLVNASIIFGTSTGHSVDTLVVNQYFSQGKLQ